MRWPLDALLVAAVPLLALFPLHNNDLWWHLAAGRWIVEHHAVPRTDVFSWTHYLGAWVDNEWLGEVLFYGVWRAGGEAALIALRALLYLGAALLLRAWMHAMRAPRAFAPALACAIALSHAWWELRPSVFTVLGLLALMLLLERRRYRWLPPLFLVWANVHPGFVLGLAAAVGELARGRPRPQSPGASPGDHVIADRPRRGGAPRLRARAPARQLSVLLAVLATFLNPYGYRIYEQQLHIGGNRAYRALVDEWLVPRAPVLALIIAALILLILNIRRVPLRRIVPLVATATLALTAVRFEEYFAWIALPIVLTIIRGPKWRLAVVGAAIVAGWSPLVVRATGDAFGAVLAQRQHIASLVAVLLAAGALWKRRIHPVAVVVPAVVLAILIAIRTPPIEPARYPGACLRRLPLGARLYNRLSFGGWLIWKGGPQPFIDGRCSGQPLFFEYVAAQVRYARPVLDRRGVDWVLAAPQDGVVPQLGAAPEWELVCRDEASLVFRRKSVSAREFSP